MVCEDDGQWAVWFELPGLEMTMQLFRMLMSNLACICTFRFCWFILILCYSIIYSCLIVIPEWRRRFSQTPFPTNTHTYYTHMFSLHVVCCLVTVGLTGDINVLSVCRVICTITALRLQKLTLLCFKLNMTCRASFTWWKFFDILKQ